MVEPNLGVFVAVVLSLLIVSILFNIFRQPFMVAYIITGILIGPYGLKLVSDTMLIQNIGDLGVVILLFFVGMEICLPCLLSNWRVAVIGALFQIIISVVVVLGLGSFFGWTIGARVLLGFVISLSSTALVVKILEERKEMKTKVGGDVLGVLLVQDLAVIPMLIIISLLGKEKANLLSLGLQVIMGVIIIAFIIWLLKRREWKLPFSNRIKEHHELQVFAALTICFGFALLTQLFRLSPALGAFIAGITVGLARETNWIHQSLKSFRVVFIALFFVSVGMLLNLKYVIDNIGMILTVVAVVFIINTLINSLIFRMLGDPWRRSFYGGALLSQIGEFSFVLGALGLQVGLITSSGYQIAIAVISITLLFSPLWIYLFGRLVCKDSICIVPPKNY